MMPSWHSKAVVGEIGFCAAGVRIRSEGRRHETNARGVPDHGHAVHRNEGAITKTWPGKSISWIAAGCRAWSGRSRPASMRIPVQGRAAERHGSAGQGGQG